jgi:hypothetical protein
MEFKGGSLLGAKYGQLSPLDYTGLKLWVRGTDGMAFLRGNSIKQWSDLSGNGNHFITGATPYVINTIYGPSVKAGGNGSANLSLVSSLGTFNFLGNGSPNTVMFVGSSSCTISAPSSTGSFGTWGGGFTTANSTLQIAKVSPPGTTNSNFVIQNAGSGSTTGSFSPATPVTRPGNLFEISHYGNTGLPYKIAMKANGVITRRWTAYTNAPDPAQVMTNPYLFLPQGNASVFFEIIIYDHTGKSQLQIESEMANLSELYIKKRYPGIY